MTGLFAHRSDLDVAAALRPMRCRADFGKNKSQLRPHPTYFQPSVAGTELSTPRFNT
jgi:hypothetical protein